MGFLSHGGGFNPITLFSLGSYRAAQEILDQPGSSSCHSPLYTLSLSHTHTLTHTHTRTHICAESGRGNRVCVEELVEALNVLDDEEGLFWDPGFPDHQNQPRDFQPIQAKVCVTMETDPPLNLSALDKPSELCDYLSPSVSRYEKNLVPIVYMLIFILGFLGNLLAVCVLGQRSLRCSVANTYLLNLAASDLIFLLGLPFWAAYYRLGYDWPFGSVMCKLCGSLLSLNIYASIFFITGMSVDRYRAIVYPLRSNYNESAYRARSVLQARCMCLVIWVLAALTTVPTLVYRNTHHMREFNVTVCGVAYPSPFSHAMLTLAKNVLGFMVPFVVIAACYGRIGWHLLASPDLVEPDSARLERVRRLALAVVAAFFVCWFPFHTLAFMSALRELGVTLSCHTERTVGALTPAAICLGFANSAVNPLLYCFVGNRFRQQLRRLCEDKVQNMAKKKRDSVSMRLSSFSRKLSDTKGTVTSVTSEDKQ